MWNTMHGDKPKVTDVETPAVEEGDLIGNLVRSTDNSFRGVHDPRLTGKDIGDDEDEEDAEK